MKILFQHNKVNLKITVYDDQLHIKYGVFSSAEKLVLPYEEILKVEAGSLSQDLVIYLVNGEILRYRVASVRENAEEIVSIIRQALKDYKEASNNSVSKATNDIDKIKKLHELLEKGLITEKEFEKKKKEILSRL